MIENRQQRIEQMKQRHQELIAQLKAIRETAKSENAQKTVAELDAMIKKMEEQSQKMLERIEKMDPNDIGRPMRPRDGERGRPRKPRGGAQPAEQ